SGALRTAHSVRAGGRGGSVADPKRDDDASIGDAERWIVSPRCDQLSSMTIDTLTETTTISTLLLTTADTSLVTGGTLFAFSTFVMPGLRQLPAPTAVAAMQ